VARAQTALRDLHRSSVRRHDAESECTRSIMIRVDSIQSAGTVLTVRCSGEVAIGSASVTSMRSLSDAVEHWIREHRHRTISEIVMDFSAVHYRWGDAPISCFIPFVRRGVQRIRFLADAATAEALENLFRAANMPWFSVQRTDQQSE
jgi:hypothetical protein